MHCARHLLLNINTILMNYFLTKALQMLILKSATPLLLLILIYLQSAEVFHQILQWQVEAIKIRSV
jgi:hypothetical protein